MKAGPSKLQRVTFASTSFHGDTSPTSPLLASEVRASASTAPGAGISALPKRSAPPPAAARPRNGRRVGGSASQSRAAA